MKKNMLKGFLAYLFVFSALCGSAQIDQYGYKRKLQAPSAQWHSVPVPYDIYRRAQKDLDDIRIYGIRDDDTLEAPYILKNTAKETTEKEVAFRLINQSRDSAGYYYTLRLESKAEINRIQLYFKNENFEYFLRLDGSHDEAVWHTVLDRYRILSIHNRLSSYAFTTLSFPASDYTYYRLFIPAPTLPVLDSASVTMRVEDNADLEEHVTRFTRVENKENKTTELFLDLRTPLPVRMLKVVPSDSLDYYRDIVIEYATDSIKTAEGWRYVYSRAGAGTLFNMEPAVYRLSGQVTRHLKVVIYNGDNRPLDIRKTLVYSDKHTLIVRFPETATWYMVYGNQKAQSPDYDIRRFEASIPPGISPLRTEPEEEIVFESDPVAPLFESEIWLWSLIIFILIVLAMFAWRMVRNVEEGG